MSQPPDPSIDLAKILIAHSNSLRDQSLGSLLDPTPQASPPGWSALSIFAAQQAPAPASGLGLGALGILAAQQTPAPGLGLLGGLPLASIMATGALNAPTAEDRKWIHLVARFEAFLGNLKLTSNQLTDGQKKFAGVVSCLNNAYYGHNSSTANAFFIGSWAKDTHVRPPRDVDLYFVLPYEVYLRYEGYASGVNKQSALLQEVKGKLAATYGATEIRGDGPVVLAGFWSYDLEIVPAFKLQEDRAYWVCDTKNGGSYMTAKPLHEVDHIRWADGRTSGNARNLVRMLKAWQAECSVPIKSFYLELLAIEFLDQSEWKNHDLFYYDWICRDFLKWMIGKAGSFVIAPGTYQTLWLGDAWKSRAESAYGRAVKACEYETKNRMTEAGDEWQKIFGADIPRYV